jgi:hypothetical protein
MGTGGATALGSPESDAGLADSPLRGERADTELWRRCRSWKEPISYQQSTAADPLTSTYRSSFRLRTADATTSFVLFLRSFDLLCAPSSAVRGRRLNRKVNDQAKRVISTPELNTLLCLHPEPINVVVYHDPSGRSHLGIGLALRCFQRLSFPNIATQRCR